MITIRKLCQDNIEDFLYFFEQVAFTDHAEWACCYCLEGHVDRKTDEETQSHPEVRREMAIDLIGRGVLQGYLAYAGESVVGWCSAGCKISYKKLQENPEFRIPGPAAVDEAHIKSIYCFDIAPAYRGQGIATRMLERVCIDAEAEGFTHVEVYPFLDTTYEYPYHGTAHMYEKQGFVTVATGQWIRIMQKALC